jgi:hypothetical protein
MKITNLVLLVVWPFAIALFAGSITSCPAEDLYSAAITAKFNAQRTSTNHVCHRVNGEKECEDVEVDTIQSFPANNASLLNLLLGRSPLSPPPPNVMFAVSFDCDSSSNGLPHPFKSQLVIFDRSTSNVVAVVADLTDFDLIVASKVICSGNDGCEAVDTSYQGFIRLSFRSLGTPGTNSIDSGEVRLYAKGSLNRDGCFNKVISSGTGKIEATAEGEEVELFVSNFTLVTGRKVGTLSSAQSASASGDTTITPVSTTLSGSTLGGYVDTTLSVSGVTRTWGGSDPAPVSAWIVALSPNLTHDKTLLIDTNNLSGMDPSVAAWVQQGKEAPPILPRGF